MDWIFEYGFTLMLILIAGAFILFIVDRIWSGIEAAIKRCHDAQARESTALTTNIKKSPNRMGL